MNHKFIIYEYYPNLSSFNFFIFEILYTIKFEIFYDNKTTFMKT